MLGVLGSGPLRVLVWVLSLATSEGASWFWTRGKLWLFCFVVLKNKFKLFNNTHFFDGIFWWNHSPSSADGSWILTDPLLKLAVGGILTYFWCLLATCIRTFICMFCCCYCCCCWFFPHSQIGDKSQMGGGVSAGLKRGGWGGCQMGEMLEFLPEG